MSEERITNLEMTIAHLEQRMDEMSDVVLEQSKMIEYLKAKVKLAEGKIEDLESGKNDDKGLSSIEIAARDKPPHY